MKNSEEALNKLIFKSISKNKKTISKMNLMTKIY